MLGYWINEKTMLFRQSIIIYFVNGTTNMKLAIFINLKNYIEL